ncbi:unnamed protein product [Spirodela intermedia]|uniref:Uncharacterized protein n=1 Tax=Spirodela intermedia TaxID=51605 RepID=A0A7I8IIP2_SPIIN|nr:unnamed protein product [Spirodela intermedia]CAA6657219.1 unnamed protein product [Spirodela intermedia]
MLLTHGLPPQGVVDGRAGGRSSGWLPRRWRREGRGSAKAAAAVADHITQAVKSTSNLIHLMQENSPSQAQLAKLTKNLLVKTVTIKNTGQVLEQLPRVISSLDAYMDSGLQSSPHLDTVGQLLSNMESSRIRSAFGDQRSKEVIIPVLTIFQKMFMYKLILN